MQTVFLELLDGKLATPEEARAFLEPYSPPAPPPQVTIKRPRAKRGAEAKLKGDSFDDDSEDHLEDDEDLDDMGGDDDDLALGLHLPKVDLDADLAVESEAAGDEDEDEEDGNHPKPARQIGCGQERSQASGPTQTGQACSAAQGRAQAGRSSEVPTGFQV